MSLPYDADGGDFEPEYSQPNPLYLVELTATEPGAEPETEESEDAATGPRMAVAGLRTFLKKYEKNKLPVLSPAEVAVLSKQVQAGNLRAKQKMMEHNVPLVIFIAKDYRDNGLPLEDLISYGIIGLNRAVEKFEPSLGTFSNYAEWWITRDIRNALADHTRTIRVPRELHERRVKINQIRGELWGRYGRAPTVMEVAQAAELTEEQTWAAWYPTEIVASLNQPPKSHHHTDSTELEDLLPDEHSIDPAQAVFSIQRTEVLQDALSTLEPIERELIGLRFAQERTLDEITAILGADWNRKSVAKAIEAALEKLAGKDYLRNAVYDPEMEPIPEAVQESPRQIVHDGETLTLSAAQYKVMKMMPQTDKSYPVIAKELGMNPSTVKFHGRSVMLVLGHASREEAVPTIHRILSDAEAVA